MVIYDLDGSDTDSEVELSRVGPLHLSAAVKATAADSKRQHALQHRTNGQVDRFSGEIHEARSSASFTGEAVDLSEYGENEPPRKRPKPVVAEPERIQWSDEGSTNDGEAVYKEFKARKSKARR